MVLLPLHCACARESRCCAASDCRPGDDGQRPDHRDHCRCDRHRHRAGGQIHLRDERCARAGRDQRRDLQSRNRSGMRLRNEQRDWRDDLRCRPNPNARGWLRSGVGPGTGQQLVHNDRDSGRARIIELRPVLIHEVRACTHKSASCKRGSGNVRFAPNPTEALRCRELTRRASCRPS